MCRNARLYSIVFLRSLVCILNILDKWIYDTLPCIVEDTNWRSIISRLQLISCLSSWYRMRYSWILFLKNIELHIPLPRQQHYMKFYIFFKKKIHANSIITGTALINNNGSIYAPSVRLLILPDLMRFYATSLRLLLLPDLMHFRVSIRVSTAISFLFHREHILSIEG